MTACPAAVEGKFHAEIQRANSTTFHARDFTGEVRKSPYGTRTDKWAGLLQLWKAVGTADKLGM